MTGTRRSNSPYSFFLTAVNTRSPSACGSGLAFAAIGAKVLAGGTEHIAHRAAAVVNAVDDRLGKRHEPPHEVERQVGARLGDPVGDHRPRKIQVADEVGAFLPIDEGMGRPECCDPLAGLGGDDLAPASPASSGRSRRLIAGCSPASSTSMPARRSAPSRTRVSAVTVFFEAMSRCSPQGMTASS
jgi:hypothetical protein